MTLDRLDLRKTPTPPSSHHTSGRTSIANISLIAITIEPSEFSNPAEVMPPPPIEAYQVGWVCALPKELTAARAMLDEEHRGFRSQMTQDNNSYVLGQIHGHHVSSPPREFRSGLGNSAAVPRNGIRDGM